MTDVDMEAAINATVKDGWKFEGIHFAMRDSSRRPSMAFILFIMEVSGG
ncbi:MAG: DUF4177 domain-containing protein [Deltaproteobacteria bacterium]|nr:DUF4177 domain-containing protein [Deltaproteobacteria bacterium]